MLKNIVSILALVLSLAGSQTAHAAGPPQSLADKDAAAKSAPVRIDGAVLFPVRGIATHPARERAAAIAGRIIALADDPAVKADSLVAIESDNSTDIMAGDRFIMSIYDVHAELDKVPRKVLAKAYVMKIRTTIEAYRRDRGDRRVQKSCLSPKPTRPWSALQNSWEPVLA
jgi:hypothetical protein